MLTDLERTLLSARDIARCIREAATDDHETPETAYRYSTGRELSEDARVLGEAFELLDAAGAIVLP
jgi:hypothetical protein